MPSIYNCGKARDDFIQVSAGLNRAEGWSVLFLASFPKLSLSQCPIYVGPTLESALKDSIVISCNSQTTQLGGQLYRS